MLVTVWGVGYKFDPEMCLRMETYNFKSWSISSKLWLAITVLILAILGGLGLTITWLFWDFYLQQKLISLKLEATEISAQLATVPSWSARLKLLETF
jgi:two-component system sensor histidine kinase ResE